MDQRDQERPGTSSLETRVRPSAVASLVTAATLGWLTWFLSVPVTGEAEPWDASGFYFYGSLFGSGILATILYPRNWWVSTLGVYLGQVTYIELWYSPTLHPGDPIISPSWLSVGLFGTLPALLGALLIHLGREFIVGLNSKKP